MRLLHDEAPNFNQVIVTTHYRPWKDIQTELTGIVEKPDLAAVVAKATKLVIDQTIDIPRIVVVPTGDVTSGFNSFQVDCTSIHLQPVSRELLIQHLRTSKQEFLQNLAGQVREARPEDYLVRALIDFDDICYDDHADLLYNLAGQVVKHLRSYLSEADAVNVLQYHQQQLAALIHSQMQTPEHRWEKATGYKATVSRGFLVLKDNAYTVSATDDIKPFRMTLSDPTNIKRYLFGGFAKCLYDRQKFDVDTERRFAIILEDDGDVLKWFKPARGQFQIYYNKDAAYEPDFVVETKKQLYLCEPKRADQMQNPEVLAKKAAALAWCNHATEHAKQHGGKQWSYPRSVQGHSGRWKCGVALTRVAGLLESRLSFHPRLTAKKEESVNTTNSPFQLTESSSIPSQKPKKWQVEPSPLPNSSTPQSAPPSTWKAEQIQSALAQHPGPWAPSQHRTPGKEPR